MKLKSLIILCVFVLALPGIVTAQANEVVNPANIATLPNGTNVLLDFNAFTAPVDNQPIPANHAGITWTNLVEGAPFAGVATWNFYIANGGAQGTLTFPRPVIVRSVRVSSGASNRFTLIGTGNANVSLTTSSDNPQTLNTNWTNPITTLVIQSSTNDQVLDDLRFTISDSSMTVTPTYTRASTPVSPTITPTATRTNTSTPSPPTLTRTPTNTALPPTVTRTPTITQTGTVAPPTATHTQTATATRTTTVAPPTLTPTRTATTVVTPTPRFNVDVQPYPNGTQIPSTLLTLSIPIPLSLQPCDTLGSSPCALYRSTFFEVVVEPDSWYKYTAPSGTVLEFYIPAGTEYFYQVLPQ